MRILITGGAGFIGRALLSHLWAQGEDEVVLLLREHYAHALPPHLQQNRAGFEPVYADLRDLAATKTAVRRAAPHAVIHLAAAGATNPFLPVETAVAHNVTGTLNLLQASFTETAPPRQLIIARTPGELSSMNVYAASKAAAWQFCRMYARTRAWPIRGAMIFQAYGPGQPERALIPAARQAAQRGEDFPMTAGEQRRDWVAAADVARGLTAVLAADLAPGMTVDLGTGILTSVAEVVRLIYKLVGGDGRALPGAVPDRPGEAAEQAADAARTQKLIGWETAVSLPQGLQNLLQTG